MVQLRDVSLERSLPSGGVTSFAIPGARRVVVTWDAPATARIDARVSFLDDVSPESFLLCDREGRGSLRRSVSRTGVCAELAVDELRASRPLASIAIRGADVRSVTVAASSVPHRAEPSGSTGAPSAAASADRARPPISLGLVPRSQYEEAPLATDDADFAQTARGWCAPASLAMLLAFHGTALATREIALAVFDRAFGGTGNWSFGAGFAGRFGFSAVAYLRDLAHARSFIAEGFPLALSFAWKPGDLPGAPLESSSGHLAVLRGFDAAGDPCFADPAQAAMTATYGYDAFERVWLGHGGVAILVAPSQDAGRMLALANAAGSRA